MFAKIDAILGPFVRWTNIIVGSAFLIWLLFFVNVVTSPGNGADETFRDVALELTAEQETPLQTSE